MTVEFGDDFVEGLIDLGDVPGFSELSHGQLDEMRKFEWDQLDKIGGSDFRIRNSDQNLR